MHVAASIQSPSTVKVTVSLANKQKAQAGPWPCGYPSVATSCLTKLDTRQAYIRLYYPTTGLKVSRLHSIKLPLALAALRGKGLIELDHKCNLA